MGVVGCFWSIHNLIYDNVLEPFLSLIPQVYLSLSLSLSLSSVVKKDSHAYNKCASNMRSVPAVLQLLIISLPPLPAPVLSSWFKSPFRNPVCWWWWRAVFFFSAPSCLPFLYLCISFGVFHPGTRYLQSAIFFPSISFSSLLFAIVYVPACLPVFCWVGRFAHIEREKGSGEKKMMMMGLFFWLVLVLGPDQGPGKSRVFLDVFARGECGP